MTQAAQTYPPVLLDYARESHAMCSFHRERMTRAGLPESAAIRNFTDVPLMTSAEVSAAGPQAILADSLTAAIRDGSVAGFDEADRIVRISQTSSSSGNAPKLSMYTEADWINYRETLPRLTAGADPTGFARIFNCFAATHSAGRFINDAFPMLGSLVLNRHHTATTPEQVLAQLTLGFSTLGNFTCLAAPPFTPGAVSKGATIADLLEHDFDNVIGENIRTVITAGAATSGDFDLRQQLDEATEMAGKPPIQIVEWYGAAEVGIAAVRCQHGGLHLTGGPVHTEVVDPETRLPLADGERGIVVVTATRGGSRYLRYVVGDEAVIHTGPCSCGQTTPRLSDIARFEDMARLQRGCASTEVAV
ncbi:hypothetical protein PGB28_12385 [Primorskyibacter aestuariivivens]|uniref:hypothetical protein n=1 Tax=Primorskyibacter aestuariivivens TaxID=1888912 RepID=UPI002301AED4|nr:hypothetical protein [Primorskyibacter aestuariivivens]MDA7429260.1 hypothetical protein [Primorskyibacter aestuariivivens]